jgi:hypothetical protein
MELKKSKLGRRRNSLETKKDPGPAFLPNQGGTHMPSILMI